MKNKKTTYLPDEFVYKETEIEFSDMASNIDVVIEKSNQNLKLLEDLGQKSEEAGFEVLGGNFSLPVADGKVFHQVVAYNKQANLYFVKRCSGICLDEYFDSYIGEGQWLDANWVKDKILGEKTMKKLFS